MSGELRQNLNLPVLEACVVAEKMNESIFRSLINYSWHVEFVHNPNDGRYNWGYAKIESYEIDSFINSLRNAHNKIVRLGCTNLNADYRENYYYKGGLGLEIVTSDGKGYLRVSIDSKTKTFYKVMSSDDIEKCIKILQSARIIGDKLTNNLRIFDGGKEIRSKEKVIEFEKNKNKSMSVAEMITIIIAIAIVVLWAFS